MVDCLEICRASQAHFHCMICCALNHIRKMQDGATLWSGLYITYRAIPNIGLYNWLLQRGLLKLRFCIIVYLYRDIHYHAIAPGVKQYTYLLIHSYMLYPYTDILGITVYANIHHRCVQTIHLYSVYPYTHL